MRNFRDRPSLAPGERLIDVGSGAGKRSRERGERRFVLLTGTWARKEFARDDARRERRS